MAYRFSQLVDILSRKDLAGAPASGSNRLPGDICIDFEKSNISIMLPLHHTMRQNRKINTLKAKNVCFYRGQPVKIFLEIYIKHPIAEGASLVLSSPFLVGNGRANDSAARGKRLLHKVREFMKCLLAAYLCWRQNLTPLFAL